MPSESRMNGFPTSQSRPEFLDRPSSRHSGGVIVAFADGSTQFLRDNVPYFILQHLMAPQSAESDHYFESYVLKVADYD